VVSPSVASGSAFALAPRHTRGHGRSAWPRTSGTLFAADPHGRSARYL